MYTGEKHMNVGDLCFRIIYNAARKKIGNMLNMRGETMELLTNELIAFVMKGLFLPSEFRSFFILFLCRQL